jgi:beta-lactam-binding protein with PASTA domain/tRNA A-37 threonylcarbamoyl transferase component Bud32
MAVQDTLINTLFDGRYRIIRRLGSGGMANVYLAEDEELGRRVAIKVLDEKHANDDQFVERFRREAKNAASLSHPNIVSIYDRGEAEGTYYIAMEYIEGRTLKDLIVAHGPLPVDKAVAYARQILGALRFAHRKGIVHRDIKPHNVLVDSDGRLKVTDFGIARAGASQMTEAGSIIGTAQYLSPEQARGAPVDQRSDLYSVGVVLNEMLTGSVPFSGDTPVEIAMKHLSAVPKPPSASRPDVPEDLDLVTVRALAKDPRERFQTAEEMDSELGRVLAGLSVTDATADAATAVLAGAGVSDAAPTAVVRRPPAPPYTRTGGYYYDEPPPPARRSIWPWLLALGLVIAAAVAGLYAYERIQDELNANKPVAVPLLEGQEEALAVNNILDRDLEPHVVRQYRPDDSEKGRVFDQDPESGERIERGNAVTIYVSQGKRKVDVPTVLGLSVAEAVARLKDAGLNANDVGVFSTKPEGTVIGQDPGEGKRVAEGTTVRINVSQGEKPIAVPDVVGRSYEDAKAALEGEGFVVKRQDQNSNIQANTVIETKPAADSGLQRGATVTVIVSKGPKDVAVPNVVDLDEETARTKIEDAGFSVSVSDEPTDDPANDGFVLAQDPPGGNRAEPGATVVIFVGRFSDEQQQ